MLEVSGIWHDKNTLEFILNDMEQKIWHYVKLRARTAHVFSMGKGEWSSKEFVSVFSREDSGFSS